MSGSASPPSQDFAAPGRPGQPLGARPPGAARAQACAPRAPRGPCEVSRPRARPGGGGDGSLGPRRRGPTSLLPPSPPAPAPHARAAPLPAERRGACCFLLGMLLGPPQPSPQPPPEFAGRGDAGTRGPGAGATPRRAQLWPRPRGLRAPGAPRMAGAARMDRRARAAQLAAAAAARAAPGPPGCGRSARGLGAEPGVIPGAGRGRSGGRSEGRPAARAPCRWRCAGRALSGRRRALPRLPGRAASLRAQLSRPLSAGGGGRGGRC